MVERKDKKSISTCRPVEWADINKTLLKYINKYNKSPTRKKKIIPEPNKLHH